MLKFDVLFENKYMEEITLTKDKTRNWWSGWRTL